MKLKNYDVLEEGDLPESCLEDCWKDKLNFSVEPISGFNYLVRECGLPAEDLVDIEYILWIACHDIEENGMFNRG